MNPTSKWHSILKFALWEPCNRFYLKSFKCLKKIDFVNLEIFGFHLLFKINFYSCNFMLFLKIIVFGVSIYFIWLYYMYFSRYWKQYLIMKLSLNLYCKMFGHFFKKVFGTPCLQITLTICSSCRSRNSKTFLLFTFVRSNVD